MAPRRSIRRASAWSRQAAAILKVDGQDLDGATHQDAVDIIQQSGSVIRLLIQRTDPDQVKTLFAASDADDAVEHAWKRTPVPRKTRTEDDPWSTLFNRR